MIKLANTKTEQDVRRMWKICFGDSEEFMNLYFSQKYKNENTLVYFEAGKAVASLQMLPYPFTFCGVEIPVSYVSGACTLPEYRNHGYMGKLLLAAFEVMQSRNIPLSILIPAEDRLYGYYARYGYETVFESDEKEIPLKKIVDNSNGNLDIAYTAFDSFFRNKDFCVRKTQSDFITIVKDAELDHFSPKTNLSGMARIINAENLLSFFAKKYPHKSFLFETEDKFLPFNNGIYKIEDGLCEKTIKEQKNLLCMNENTLCQLLFGFHLESLSEELTIHFEDHYPIMNLMLE